MNGRNGFRPEAFLGRTDLKGEQQEERPLSGVVALQDLAGPLCEQSGRVLPLLAPGHALAVVEVVSTGARAIAGLVAAGGMSEMLEPETEQLNPFQGQTNLRAASPPVVIHTSSQRAVETVKSLSGGQAGFPGGRQTASNTSERSAVAR